MRFCGGIQYSGFSNGVQVTVQAKYVGDLVDVACGCRCMGNRSMGLGLWH